MKKLVVMDIDGVLAEFEEAITAEVYKKFGLECERSLFRIEHRYSSHPQALRYAQTLVDDPNFYYALRGNDDGLYFLNKIIGNGHKVIYLSSRPRCAESHTFRWLQKWVGRYDHSLFCGVNDKAYFLGELGSPSIDFVVEDSPAQIKHLKDAGLPVLCWSQPWNQRIFPRLYVRSDYEIMLWPAEDVESYPFFRE